MRFFGLLSRLWVCNPLKSHRNPPNRGGNSSQSRLRRFSQSYAIQMVLAQSMRITGGLCPWPQYQCRAGQCCNQRDNVCSDMVWTKEVMHNQNSQNWMFLYFAIRSQSNFHSLQSTPIVAGFQDCRMWLENWKSSVLDCYKILQNSYVIAMGFSGCSDMPCCKILG